MNEYRLFETQQFDRDLRRISRAGHRAVVDKLRKVVYPQLRQHPHVGPHIRRLKAYEPPTWRYTVLQLSKSLGLDKVCPCIQGTG